MFIFLSEWCQITANACTTCCPLPAGLQVTFLFLQIAAQECTTLLTCGEKYFPADKPSVPTAVQTTCSWLHVHVFYDQINKYLVVLTHNLFLSITCCWRWKKNKTLPVSSFNCLKHTPCSRWKSLTTGAHFRSRSRQVSAALNKGVQRVPVTSQNTSSVMCVHTHMHACTHAHTMFFYSCTLSCLYEFSLSRQSLKKPFQSPCSQSALSQQAEKPSPAAPTKHRAAESSQKYTSLKLLPNSATSVGLSHLSWCWVYEAEETWWETDWFIVRTKRDIVTFPPEKRSY